ncbi:Polyketide synthase [Alternaria alternata]|nr:Polyketide synthase [Alternaria alternata]
MDDAPINLTRLLHLVKRLLQSAHLQRVSHARPTSVQLNVPERLGGYACGPNGLSYCSRLACARWHGEANLVDRAVRPRRATLNHRIDGVVVTACCTQRLHNYGSYRISWH